MSYSYIQKLLEKMAVQETIHSHRERIYTDGCKNLPAYCCYKRLHSLARCKFKLKKTKIQFLEQVASSVLEGKYMLSSGRTGSSSRGLLTQHMEIWHWY